MPTINQLNFMILYDGPSEAQILYGRRTDAAIYAVCERRREKNCTNNCSKHIDFEPFSV